MSKAEGIKPYTRVKLANWSYALAFFVRLDILEKF